MPERSFAQPGRRTPLPQAVGAGRCDRPDLNWQRPVARKAPIIGDHRHLPLAYLALAAADPAHCCSQRLYSPGRSGHRLRGLAGVLCATGSRGRKKGITVFRGATWRIMAPGSRTAISPVSGPVHCRHFRGRPAPGQRSLHQSARALAIFAITVFLSLLGYLYANPQQPAYHHGQPAGAAWPCWGCCGGYYNGKLKAPRFQPSGGPAPTGHGRAFALVIMQIVLGGWSSANYARPARIDQLRGEIFRPDYLADAFNPLRRIALDDQGQVIRPDSLAVLDRPPPVRPADRGLPGLAGAQDETTATAGGYRDCTVAVFDRPTGRRDQRGLVPATAVVTDPAQLPAALLLLALHQFIASAGSASSVSTSG